ncbi:MAG: DNA methyltransferase [Candidatus Thorarchaeota archaeon]
MTNILDSNKNNDLKDHLNDLDGKEWLKLSISVWNIVKTPEERKLNHPAMFPVELCERLIKIFTKEGEIVLDPFAGSGSTIIGANKNNRKAVGFEINKEFISLFKSRLEQKRIISNFGETKKAKKYKFFNKNCNQITDLLKPESVDLCLTSPPYWDILRMKRTADYKEARPYSEEESDLGNIEDYNNFLLELKKIFQKIYEILKPNKFCIIILMDIRKKDKLYTFHIDTVNFMREIGFELDDIIIWNRKMEYNNLRPLGYPYVFRVNRIHEYILLFQKRVKDSNYD